MINLSLKKTLYFSIIDNESLQEGVYRKEKIDSDIKQKMIDTDHPFRFALSPSLCNKLFAIDCSYVIDTTICFHI